ncbi:unnamed protein product [Urochloa decumbens]|uniref:9-cis-epoxycarotenoid dioxygenase n=1 Tax=Urochloa decumbens TaxID=240449 RepID=A0ABC9FKQ3_9POAL
MASSVTAPPAAAPAAAPAKSKKPSQLNPNTGKARTAAPARPMRAATPAVRQHPASTPSSPNWNPFQRLAAAALDAVEATFISNLLERSHPLPKTADPSIQIAGNYAPVPDHPPSTLLPTTGTLPASLSGVYVRNGANPLHAPRAGHHLFDGDGMLHAVRLNHGRAESYACRFTETSRLRQERAIGKPAFPKPIGELHGHSGVARLLLFAARSAVGVVDASQGIGVANAGLVFFNGRLLAMSEDDLPYHVRVTESGDLATVGRYDFDGQLDRDGTMIAHPKLDPVTGELFAMSYNVISKPYLKYFFFDAGGRKSADVEIPVAEPTMMHDFAITENYAVIPDQQIVFKLQEMVLGGGSPVVYDKNKTSRFGVLPKHAADASELVWVEVPDCFCFHLWNAWEDKVTGEVVVIGSCMTPADAVFNDSGEEGESFRSVLTEIRLDTRTGTSRRRAVLRDGDQVNLEAGMVNRQLLGRKTRYVYLAIAEPWPKVSGFAKVDLEAGTVEKFVYGEGRYGGEPCFVPRPGGAAGDDDDEEDDGYVLCYVHDEVRGESEMLVVNAQDMREEAAVKLPGRVPYGLHGTFISGEDLQRQA